MIPAEMLSREGVVISGGSTGLIYLLPSGYVPKIAYSDRTGKQSLRDIELDYKICQKLPRHHHTPGPQRKTPSAKSSGHDTVEYYLQGSIQSASDKTSPTKINFSGQHARGTHLASVRCQSKWNGQTR